MDVLLRVLLSLSALAGIHSITTVSKVSVRAGGSITIPCLYESQYINHVKYLCKGYYWNSCSYAIKTNQHNSGKFSISDDKERNIFTVIIQDLTKEDTDYWCAVEINGGGDERKYFKLSVTETPSLDISNQEITGSTAIDCTNSNSGEMKWCRLGGFCLTKSGSIDGTEFTISGNVAGVFTVTMMSELSKESNGWYWCVKGDLQMPVHITVTENNSNNNDSNAQGETSSDDLKAYIIPLSLLIFIVLVTVFIWFMLKRHKQTKEAASAMTAAGEEITCSTVTHKRNTSSQSSPAESAVDVVYSSVIPMKQQHVPKVEANNENVTYSTLA